MSLPAAAAAAVPAAASGAAPRRLPPDADRCGRDAALLHPLAAASDTAAPPDTAVPLTEATAWAALAAVPDPEIPAISVVDLGIVRDLQLAGDAVTVVVTPTYSGCPATELIGAALVAALRAAGARTVAVQTRLAPAWTTDWIAPAARARLAAGGIVPPQPAAAAAAQPLRFVPRLICPHCASRDTERLAEFGSTPCKSLYRCRACAEPFEYFKPL